VAARVELVVPDGVAQAGLKKGIMRKAIGGVVVEMD
jgi:hypothetical protein